MTPETRQRSIRISQPHRRGTGSTRGKAAHPSPLRHTCIAGVTRSGPAALMQLSDSGGLVNRTRRPNSLRVRGLRSRGITRVVGRRCMRFCESARGKAHINGIFQPLTGRFSTPTVETVNTSPHFHIRISPIAGGKSRGVSLVSNAVTGAFQQVRCLGRWLRPRRMDEVRCSLERVQLQSS